MNITRTYDGTHTRTQQHSQHNNTYFVELIYAGVSQLNVQIQRIGSWWFYSVFRPEMYARCVSTSVSTVFFWICCYWVTVVVAAAAISRTNAAIFVFFLHWRRHQSLRLEQISVQMKQNEIRGETSINYSCSCKWI